MKLDYKIIVIDWFFKDYFDGASMHKKVIQKWFRSNKKLKHLDSNQFYDFKNYLITYLIDKYDSTYSFDYEEVIYFYKNIKIDTEMEEKFKKQQKELVLNAL